MTDINENFNKFILAKEEDDIAFVLEQYERGVIDEASLLKTISPALSRAISVMINAPKIEKAVRHYIKIRRDFEDNHAALRAASAETHIDYRTLEKVLIKMIDKGIVPKEMSIREEFDDLPDLINTMNDIVNDLEK